MCAHLVYCTQGGDEDWYTSEEEEEIKRNDPITYPEYRQEYKVSCLVSCLLLFYIPNNLVMMAMSALEVLIMLIASILKMDTSQ